MKKLFVLLMLFGLPSCREEDSTEHVDNYVDSQQNNSGVMQFTDVIPENAPDSIKVSTINQIISDIDKDSSLQEIKTVDSLEIPIVGFFRNDTLVKIIKGKDPNYMLVKPPKFGNYRYNSYYFLMDTLIYSRYECNNYQQTGSCSPVYISIKIHYYNGRTISEIVDDQIGPSYWGCGCGMSPKYDKADKKSRERINYDHIEYLKELINTANITYTPSGN